MPTGGIDDQGPNQGFRYLTTPLSRDSMAHPTRYDYIIAANVDDLFSIFMGHQTGSFIPLFFPQGCIWKNTLRGNLRRHEAGEGATAINQSHYTMFKDQLENSHNLGLIAEGRIRGLTETETSAKVAAQGALDAAISAIETFLTGNEPPAQWNQNPVTMAFQGFVNYPSPYDMDCTP